MPRRSLPFGLVLVLRSGAYALDGTPLAVTHAIDTLSRRDVLETDYAELAAHQRRFQAAMRIGEVRVTTPPR